MEGIHNDFEGLPEHMEQLAALSQRVRDYAFPNKEQREELQKAFQPIFELQQKIQRDFAPIIEEQIRYMKSLQSIPLPQFNFPDLSSLIQPALDLQRLVQERFNHVFEGYYKTFRELPPRTQEALFLLAAHGWYLDMEMPIPWLWELTEMLSAGKIDEVENNLCEHYESRIDEIESSIIGKYPHRQKLIHSAFNAHRRQEFELSIPVFLAQVDGICKEVTKENYFRRSRKGIPRTAYYVEQITSDSYRAALLSPLAQNFPINATEDERSDSFYELNRHLVLHGESLDYGTKIFSLKAISLINYVAHVLSTEIDTP